MNVLVSSGVQIEYSIVDLKHHIKQKEFKKQPWLVKAHNRRIM